MRRHYTLDESRSFLSGLYYAYLRFLEIEAAWLIKSPDIDFKIRIGKQMGYDKESLVRISRRLEEMFCLTSKAIRVKKIEKVFSKVILASTEVQMEDWICNFHRSICNQIKVRLKCVDKNADEPTFILLSWLHESSQNGQLLFNRKSELGEKKYWPDFHVLDEIQYTGEESLPSWHTRPQRPKHFTFSRKRFLKMKSLQDILTIPNELEKFIHFICLDVEICAMEVCALNILSYRKMPLEFKTDMAQQIWDEARHALILSDYLKKLGKKVGDYPYSADVWFKYHKGKSLEEKLAIQQVLQEGDSVDNNILLINFFRGKNGYDDLYNMLTYINADETIHARIGNKWLYYLVDNSDSKYLKVIKLAAKTIGTDVPGSFVFNPAARSIAGFPSWFIQNYKHIPNHS